MSYEKLAAAGAEPKALSFYYKFDDLLDAETLYSLYRVSHKATDQGSLLVDILALTGDERDIFTSLLRECVYDLFSRFIKYTTGLSNAILFNADYTPSGGALGKYVVLKLVDNEAYNNNSLQPVSDTIEKCLRFMVLSKWLAMKDAKDEAAQAGALYTENLRLLLHISMPLKKVTIA